MIDLAKKNMPDPNMPQYLKAWGVDNISHISVVSGLDANGMQLNSELVFNGPMSGIFSLMSAWPLPEPSAKARVSNRPGVPVIVKMAKSDPSFTVGLLTANGRSSSVPGRVAGPPD